MMGFVKSGLVVLLCGVLSFALAVLVTPKVAQAVVVENNNCLRNASVGFGDCAAWQEACRETGKAHHASGQPYQFQVRRAGVLVGLWTWNDFAYHTVTIPSTAYTQVMIDNQGTGNPSAYHAKIDTACSG